MNLTEYAKLDALGLADLVRRRTDMGTAAAPEAAELTAAAAIMAELLDWSTERTRREITAAQALYAFPAGAPRGPAVLSWSP